MVPLADVVGGCGVSTTNRLWSNSLPKDRCGTGITTSVFSLFHLFLKPVIFFSILFLGGLHIFRHDTFLMKTRALNVLTSFSSVFFSLGLLLQTIPNYHEEKYRCEYLHNKLAHIKRLIGEFDQRQAESWH